MARRLIHRVKSLPTRPAVELLLIAAGTAAVMVLLFGPIALSVAPTAGLRGKDRADTINATRQTLLAAGGGLALMVGAAFTALDETTKLPKAIRDALQPPGGR